jgi:glycosyltransferase involved in cell wall biosynthesis
MNVALFPSNFHPHFGGVEELVRQLAHQLKREGHAPVVFTNRWPKDLPADEMFEGLPIHRHVFRVPERTWKQYGGAVLYGPSARRKVRRQLVEHGAEVLHVQCVSSNAHYALKAKRDLGLPLVVTLQGELTMDANQMFQRSLFAQDLLRRSLDAADVITGCSAKTLADGEAFYGKSFGGRGRVIFNAATTGDFEKSVPYVHGRPYILAIGRVVPQKGFDTLIQAFATLPAHDHDILLAGDGDQRGALEQLVRELGLQERVHFVGRADRVKVGSLFKGCSFFVLPSRADEGLPVVCAEAMASGKAIVATRSGGTPEAVIDGVSGLIVEKSDVAGLAAAMGRVIADGELRKRFAAAGLARAGEFSWPTVTGQYVEAYEAARRAVKKPMVRRAVVA